MARDVLESQRKGVPSGGSLRLGIEDVPLHRYLGERQRLVDRALERSLPRAARAPQVLHRAMRYSVLGGGKRIRPILTLASCEAVGGRVADGLPVACAIELVHAYSLIHDDLPAMDNGVMRRGKPTCHRRFGEAVAVLAGDALLTLAFELLAKAPAARQHAAVIGEVARAVGTHGMIGGQVIDTLPHRGDRATLRSIARWKTGALITCAVTVGGRVGGAPAGTVARLERYGQRVGLAFQLVDDLLDRDGCANLEPPARVRQQALRLVEDAKETLAPLGSRGIMLKRLADYLGQRVA